MIDSGPVTTQYPTAVLSIPLSINGGRHSPVADQAYSRGTERPSLTALDTKTNLQKESEPYPNLGGIKHESFSGNSSILRPFYDPILDRSQPTLQRQQHKQDCKTSDGQTQGGSPESVRSLAAGIPLPPISQLDFGFISHVRSPGRHSPLSAYSSKSPMSLSQHFTSPHPSIGGSQPYHAIYSESSPASNHNTTSPRDQYTQAISSGSSTHYEGQIYRGTTGHTPMAEIRTPISASTQGAFSPMSNARSPTNDQRPFSQDEPSSPLHQSQLVPGGYQCMHEQCIDRPAFQTQYLLSSHQNVHKPDRPYYCQVPACPRSKNGKPNSGFKRKNELIRHQLVHNSPGYACPFCPDRDHKYPRPDNLQRHVKVHHIDKSKDDPELRAILAQRIETDKGGRRRRVNSTS